jgi:hypothetical protein
MKINIITQPLFCNYGGILQNYALQEVLRRMGHEVLTVNVPPREIALSPNWKDYIHTVLNMGKRILGRYECPFLNPHTFAKKERELSEPQREFVRKHINKADCSTPFTQDTVLDHPADLWVVGSDQVWRPWCTPYIENYFFDFLDDTTPRIAYAASFGTDRWEISEGQTPRIRELASRFKAISVREASGIALCKEHLGMETQHVLDPTMLLTAEDYLALTGENNYLQGRYIATYILDPNPAKKKAIMDESCALGTDVVPFGQMHRDCFDSIESWLATIAHADRVITDSFHGTLFSIIFGKPVKILGNSIRGNSRFESLLASLKLTPNYEGYITINRENSTALERLKKESLEFINKAL